MENTRVCISHVHRSLRRSGKHTSEWSLEQVIEVIQALAQLPHGHSDAQLLGQLQPHLHRLQPAASAPPLTPGADPLLTSLAHRSPTKGKVTVGRGPTSCPHPQHQGRPTHTFRVG